MNQISTHLASPVRTFAQRLSSTRRGARLARLLAVTELRASGAPWDLTERAELVVAELAANAVLHGRSPGRDFRLVLAYDPSAENLRIEVTDTRGDLLPHRPPADAASAPPEDTGTPTEGGHGLALVTALADHWDTVPYPPSGKTVRALLSARTSSAPETSCSPARNETTWPHRTPSTCASTS